MSVIIGFVIIVMLGLTLYIAKRLFEDMKFYYLVSFCMQLFDTEQVAVINPFKIVNPWVSLSQ